MDALGLISESGGNERLLTTLMMPVSRLPQEKSQMEVKRNSWQYNIPFPYISGGKGDTDSQSSTLSLLSTQSSKASSGTWQSVKQAINIMAIHDYSLAK